jgi:hypothetical protein
MKKNTFLFVLILSLSPATLLAKEKNVAKVILMKGEAKGKSLDGTVFQVKADQDITEGSIIQTSEKSFVKLVFLDKSQMNLGPKSQMVINAFPEKEAGIITLVKGQLRSKVTKDYMDIDDKSKSKLFIKTSSAAMGIRGTDFQVNYNEENHNTALITFEGAVAMANINHNEKHSMFDQHQLESVVSSEKAVMVKEGQISAVNLNISEVAMTPTKLATGQINALKENETGIKASTEAPSDSKGKQFKSPIPPGLDGAIFSTAPKTVESKPELASANGFFNQKTGEYKLPAGSIIDLNSVNIIPPPVNAVFDANSKTYVVPSTFGKIDASTGEYKAPEGLKLGNDGKFQVVTPKERNPASESGSQGTAPAASAANTAAPAPTSTTATATTTAAAPPLPPSIMDARPDMAQFAATYAAPVIAGVSVSPPPPPPPAMNDQLRNIANNVITTTETVKNNATATNVNNSSTKAKIIFNVQ